MHVESSTSVRSSAAADTAPPILRATAWSKKYGERLVLDNVDIVVQPGEVHALVGQNGSGKSTWIKTLAGYHAPEPGASLQINGSDVELPISPGTATHLAVAFVHQDLAQNESATVMENLCAGRYARRGLAPISWRKQRARVVTMLRDAGLEGVGPDTPLAALEPVDRSLLAIARATSDLRHAERGLLVLDEPTAYLPRDGVERLFAAIRATAARGFGVLFVSHDLEEVGVISDRVTVLRDGRAVGTYDTASLTPDSLAELILGFRLDDLYPSAHEEPGEVVAQVAGLTGGTLGGLTFEARAGEIVGFTGLLGSGHDILPHLLVGMTRPTAGELEINGHRVSARKMTPCLAARWGIAVVPANRARDGLVGVATATENVTLSTLRKHFRMGWLRRRAETKHVAELANDFEVRPPNPRLNAQYFSGGNQQKLVLARCLESNPSVLVLHEPTQGVDVGTRQVLLGRFSEVAQRGAAVLVCSTEYQDLAHLCDRVFVLNRGEVSAELSGADLTHDRILELCYGPSRRNS
ncbi:sugar ABC transporter ATP-binding protein [Nocardioides sp. AN3]